MSGRQPTVQNLNFKVMRSALSLIVNKLLANHENSFRKFSGISIFRVVTQAALLENSSIRFFNWNQIWYVTFRLGEFSSKTVKLTTRFKKNE